MSECAKCNGWGVDDVTGFACPSCPTVKQSLTVELVSNPDELAAAMQADAAPVAWMYRAGPYLRKYGPDLPPVVKLAVSRWPIKTQTNWTETPLYAHPPVVDRVSTSSREAVRAEQAAEIERLNALADEQARYANVKKDEVRGLTAELAKLKALAETLAGALGPLRNTAEAVADSLNTAVMDGAIDKADKALRQYKEASDAS